MRLWTLSPKYLDTPGLNGLWKEACLAHSRLLAKGGGYYNHSEMERFKTHPAPIDAITYYLYYVWHEANNRGFNYSTGRIKSALTGVILPDKIPVTKNQVEFEQAHLAKKLVERGSDKAKVARFDELHPLFEVR